VAAIDYEAEYNNRARVPEHPPVMAGWARGRGIATRFGTVADANHFTAIAPLADPNSSMVLRPKEQARG